ncbi:MAG: hypothetical protein AAF696_23490 [Bacteroidota bacterium]
MNAHRLLFISLCMLLACNSPKNSYESEAPEIEENFDKEEPTDSLLRKDLRQTDSLTDPLDVRIAFIKEEFNIINSTPDLYQDSIPLMDQSTEGGELIAFYDSEGKLRKIGVYLYGEMGKNIDEYYLENEQLFFLFSKRFKYNSPIYHTDSSNLEGKEDIELFDLEKSEISELRYYWGEKGELIRYIDEVDSVFEELEIGIEIEEKLKLSFTDILERIKKAESTQVDEEEQEIETEDQFDKKLHSWMESIAEGNNFTYVYEKFDLNEDGVDEYLCGLRSQFWCGSGGCSFVIVAEKGGKLELLARGGPTYSPHFISTEKVKGWYSIVLDPTESTTTEGEEYKNYPIMRLKGDTYETEWLSDLDEAEEIEKLLDGATKVLGDDRSFHKVILE